MKITTRMGIGLPALVLGLAVLAYLLGYLLPSRTHVERATYIDAAPAVVYGLMSDLGQFKQWAPWQGQDANIQYDIEQPARGLGARLRWRSEDSGVGTGELSVIDAQPYDKLRMLLEFEGGERAVLAWRLEPLEGGTHIDWTLDIEHGANPASRYRGLLMARRLTGAFEPGLGHLRHLSERQPAPPAAAIATEEITYPVNDQSFTGYLAYDQNRRNRPGVLIVHEGSSHTDYIRKRAGQLAELGYVALALDIADMLSPGAPACDRQGSSEVPVLQEPKPAGSSPDIAEARANFETARQRVTAALDILKDHPAVNSEQLAAIGYCFGGNIVLNMARAGMELDGVVSFHGSLMPAGAPGGSASAMPMDGRYADAPGGSASAEPLGNPARPGEVKAGILVLNGADDPRVPQEQIQAFMQEMDSAGVDYEFINYPGAKHAFTNPDADNYDANADEQSWQKMRTFFARVFE